MNLHVIVVLASLERRCEDPRFGDDKAREVLADLISTTVAVLTAAAGRPPLGGGRPSLPGVR
jgi:hypothetical protein